MAHLLDAVIDVISRPPADRSDVDINGILPWLRRRTELLPQLDQDTVKEVVKYCGYETAESDDVILRQGDEADRMYIILRGNISVYIDASLTGEEVGEHALSPVVSPNRESPDTKRGQQSFDRANYGRFIIKYESGKQFGEAALIGEDKTRNATIVADDDCDLMVIHNKLFDRCLKDHQRKEFQMLQNFVENHPLFSHMSPKFKRLLELSLRRQDFAFDTSLVRQGERVKALYFILSGQANIFIEPGRHQKQYSHLWPFEVGTDIYAQEFEWLRESRRNAILRQYEDPAVWPTKPDSLIVKRTEGYAASEKLMHDKSVCLCSVQDGEVIGDAELVHHLSTYMQTVVCTTNTQTLVLDVKNLERVTGRRNTVTLQLLKQNVVEKLAVREGSQHGHHVPFLHFLHAKLTEEDLPERKTLPPLKNTKSLPSKEMQTQHMLERYLQGKAELVEPCVPGTLIYKDIMEEKARIRDSIRRRSIIGVNGMLRDSRRRLNRRKPRSRREIVDSLKEMIEAELVDASSQGPQKGQPPSRKTSMKGPGQDPFPKDPFPKPLPGSTPRRPSLAESVASDTSRRPSLPGDPDTPRRPLLLKESPRNVKDPPRKSSLAKDKPGSDVTVKKRVTLPPLEALTKKSQETEEKSSKPQEPDSKSSKLKSNKVLLNPMKAPETPRSRANSKVDPSLPKILEEREGTAVSRDSDPPSAPSPPPASRYVKREVQASSEGTTPPSGSAKRMPPLAKVELRRPEHVPTDRWSMALKFVNERMHDRFTEQLLTDGDSPEAKDYETSEGSLQLLESRIKQFHVKHGGFSPVRLNLKLPKLRRFKLDLEDETQRLPKPGGKVWIKKRLCQIANSKFKIKGHEHIRYHMVPELPEFDKVKKMQTVMQQLMDNSVLKKQAAEQLSAGGVGGGGVGGSQIPASVAAASQQTAESVPPLPNLSDHRASFA